MEIHLFAAFRHDLNVAVPHRVQRWADDLVRVHEPLVGQHRLDHYLGAVAKGLHDRFVFDKGARLGAIFGLDRFGHRVALGGDVGDDAFACLEPVKAAVVFGHKVHRCDHHLVEVLRAIGDVLGDFGLLGIGFAIGAHLCPCVHQVVHWDSAALGDLIVVKVMRAGDFHCARAEIRIGVFIGDNRDQAAMLFWADRDFAEFSHNWGVAFIGWVYRDGAIAQHSFRARGCDRNIIALFFNRDVPVGILFDISVGFAISQLVFEVPHVPCDFDVFHLKIGDGCFKFWVPVYETLAAIDQSLFVHLNKDFYDGVMKISIFAIWCAGCTGHRKRLARPVTAGTQPLELADDCAAAFGLPFPDFRGEFLPPQFGA